jgi:hypothetical protein
MKISNSKLLILRRRFIEYDFDFWLVSQGEVIEVKAQNKQRAEA